MTMAIAHREGDTAVLDALREVKPPFSPESVVSEFATLLKTYRITSVTGDRYGGEWPREQFRKRRIGYELSAMSKSEIYLAALPAINSRLVDLLDDSRMLSQFCGLGRRTARGGRDSIDHAPGAHDDLANAAAGALVHAAAPGATVCWQGFYGYGGKVVLLDTPRPPLPAHRAFIAALTASCIYELVDVGPHGDVGQREAFAGKPGRRREVGGTTWGEQSRDLSTRSPPPERTKKPTPVSGWSKAKQRFDEFCF